MIYTRNINRDQLVKAIRAEHDMTQGGKFIKEFQCDFSVMIQGKVFRGCVYPSSNHSRRKHRIFIYCECCTKLIPAGRLAQHYRQPNNRNHINAGFNLHLLSD